MAELFDFQKKPRRFDLYTLKRAFNLMAADYHEMRTIFRHVCAQYLPRNQDLLTEEGKERVFFCSGPFRTLYAYRLNAAPETWVRWLCEDWANDLNGEILEADRKRMQNLAKKKQTVPRSGEAVQQPKQIERLMFDVSGKGGCGTEVETVLDIHDCVVSEVREDNKEVCQLKNVDLEILQKSIGNVNWDVSRLVFPLNGKFKTVNNNRELQTLIRYWARSGEDGDWMKLQVCSKQGEKRQSDGGSKDDSRGSKKPKIVYSRPHIEDTSD